MKKHLRLILAMCAASLVPALRAEQDVTNRLNLSARLGFNVSARFRGAGSFGIGAPAQPAPRFTPQGDRYNYDNGYVLRDISGNEGGQTWYWGYDQGGQISGNSILLSRATTRTTAAASSTEDAGLAPGAELTFSRQLGVKDRFRYGFDAAVNYMQLEFQDRSSASSTTTTTTDTYAFTPGTTPPSGPYQGSYEGPGYLISSTPLSSTTTTRPGGRATTPSGSETTPDSVVGRRNFEGDLWGFRLGPYLEIPMGTNWDISLSAGLAVGILDGSGTWSDSAAIMTPSGQRVAVTRSGQSGETGLLVGGYVAANVAYRISEHWSAAGGLQFQSLSSYEHDLGGRKVSVDLGQACFVTFGVTYNF